MAYATGAAATADDLLEAIENFAIADGWTIGKRDVDLLFLEKGICHVALEAIDYTYFDAVLAANQNDKRIAGALSTSLNNSLATFHSHPGSLSTTDTDLDHVSTTQLGSGAAAYHLFSGDVGDPDYIHCAIRVNATDWKHLSFGILDQHSMTHGGAAFLVGNPGYFYPTSASPTSSGSYYNDVSDAFHPFSGGNRRMVNAQSENLYVPDALPNDPVNWPLMSAGLVNQLVNLQEFGALSWPTGGSQPNSRFNQHVITTPAGQWGGNVQLHPCPVMVLSSGLQRNCYIGDYPNVRMLNMEGLSPGDELDLGGDTWFVTPIGRQRAWGGKSDVGLNYSTGQHALAFKKIV